MNRGEVASIKAPVKKGDLVVVLTGKEKGKSGKIIEIQKDKCRVLIEKVNFVKRHTRPTQKNRQGGVVEKEASIHWSNVGLMCTKCNKPVRKKMKIEKNGNKVRVCAKCGEQFDITK